MLEQLGLSKDEAETLMPEIEKKLGNNKTKKTKKGFATTVVPDDEQEALKEDRNGQRLTLGDLFESLDQSKMMQGDQASGKEDMINTNRLEKQLKALRKEVQTTALSVPMSGRKRLKIERDTNYEQVKKQVNKWIPQVKHNREAEYLDFTTVDVIGEGGGVRLNSVNQIANNLKENQPQTALEKSITDELTKQGLRSEKDFKERELENLQHVDAKQLEERYHQLSQMKNLLFRQEIKNRRISKIKSKLYHKIKKREKDREEKKLLEYLETIDPAAAEQYRMKEEQKKVEERLKLRHSSDNKFAKKVKRFGGMDNEGIKDAYNDMMREKSALKQRTKSTTKTMTLHSSDEDSNEGSDSEELSESELKRQAVSQIEQELMDLENGSDEEGSESDSDDNEMKFENKGGKNKKNNAKNQDKGIMGLKFMQRAEERKKETLKDQA